MVLLLAQTLARSSDWYCLASSGGLGTLGGSAFGLGSQGLRQECAWGSSEVQLALLGAEALVVGLGSPPQKLAGRGWEATAEYQGPGIALAGEGCAQGSVARLQR